MAVRTGSTIGTLCPRAQGQEEAEAANVFPSSVRQQRHSSETLSADKLRYATGKIWEPEGCPYNNTITSLGMAAGLSSPTTNHSRLIVNTA